MPRNDSKTIVVDAKKLFAQPVPSAPEAEIALIGSILLDPSLISDVSGILEGPEDFYNTKHAAIYRAAERWYAEHGSLDLVQLVEQLRSDGVMAKNSGEKGDFDPAYLVELAESVPSAVNAPYYARMVSAASKARKIIDAGSRMVYDAFHLPSLTSEEVFSAVDRCQAMLFAIGEKPGTSGPSDMKSLMQQRLEELDSAEQGPRGILTGFYELDDYTRGLQNGEMLIIAARPSVGKTAIALDLAVNLAENFLEDAADGGPGKSVLLFSLEMSKAAVSDRMICSRSLVDSRALRSGRLPDTAYRNVMGACDYLANLPIHVEDVSSMTITQLRTMTRQHVARDKYPPGVIIIDYLQLLTSPQQSRESRQVEVSAISRGIKALARELNIPVVCLSQLNRASEQREGHRPRMSDLRESGSIEQDADVVMLLHREEYYHIDDPDWALANPDMVGKAELIIAKQRNGPTGVVTLRYVHEATRFENASGTRVGGWV